MDAETTARSQVQTGDHSQPFMSMPKRSVIADCVMAFLCEKRTVLEFDSIIQRRRESGSYRLRWREDCDDRGRVHRSIDLGPDLVQAEAVANLLREWKELRRAAEREARKDEAQARRAAKKLEAAEAGHERLTAMLAGGGSLNNRKQVLSEFLAAKAEGPLAAFKFAMELTERPLPTIGRPRRGRLW